MLFRQLFDATSCTYSYLLASDKGREGVIIDPVDRNLEQYLQLINELDLKLVMSIDTHLHADHITASGLLQQQTQCQIVMGSHSPAEFVSLKIAEGEKINIDGMQFKAIYTPGHTTDSYSFLWNDNLFSGDTLLIRATGRTDFQNGDAYAQYDSLFNKILKLPESTKVYPGHDYHGMTVSTIGEEKQFNPRLQVSNREEYADMMSQLNLPKPKMVDVAVPANLKCGLES